MSFWHTLKVNIIYRSPFLVIAFNYLSIKNILFYVFFMLFVCLISGETGLLPNSSNWQRHRSGWSKGATTWNHPREVLHVDGEIESHDRQEKRPSCWISRTRVSVTSLLFAIRCRQCPLSSQCGNILKPWLWNHRINQWKAGISGKQCGLFSFSLGFCNCLLLYQKVLRILRFSVNRLDSFKNVSQDPYLQLRILVYLCFNAQFFEGITTARKKSNSNIVIPLFNAWLNSGSVHTIFL